MKSLKTQDAPLYPISNVRAFREGWVHPVSHWLWIAEYLNNLLDTARRKENAPILFYQKQGSDYSSISGQIPLIANIDKYLRFWNINIDKPVYKVDKKNFHLELLPGKQNIFGGQIVGSGTFV